MSDVDDLVAALDAKYERWDLYRRAGGGWIVKVDRQIAALCPGLVEALRGALEFEPPVVIPPRPPVFRAASCEPYKDGSWWRLRHAGGYVGIRVKTKRAAVAYAELAEERSRRAIEEWEREYGAAAAEEGP